MIIKKIFDKYFQSPMSREVVKSGKVDRVNKYLIEQILNSKNGDLIVRSIAEYKSKPNYFKVDESNIENAFRSSAWDGMSLEDKIKCTSLLVEKCSKRLKIENPIKLSVVPSNEQWDNQPICACYMHDSNEIYINMDKLDNVSGIQFYNLINHECIHAGDFQNLFGKIIPHMLDYVYDTTSRRIFSTPVGDEMMRLPIYGVLSKADGSESKRIGEPLRKDILMAKNVFAVSTPNEVDAIDKVVDRNSYNRYVETMMYYASPLERNARVNALIETRKLLDEAGDTPVSSRDIADVEVLERNEKYIDNELNNFRSIIPHSINDAFDAYARYSFYHKGYDAVAGSVSLRNFAKLRDKDAVTSYSQEVGVGYDKVMRMRETDSEAESEKEL